MKKLSWLLAFVFALTLFPVSSLQVFATTTADPEISDDFPELPDASMMTLCRESESLGLTMPSARPARLRSVPFSTDLSEYILESEHFVFDLSQHDFTEYNSNNGTNYSFSNDILLDRISPAVFNKFMLRMDMLYDAMQDLTGNTPAGGQKILITADVPFPSARQYTYPGINDYLIRWNADYIIGILDEIQASNADDWWFAGVPHELGHLFHNVNSWNFDAEGFASYEAWLAIEKCGGTVVGNNVVMTGAERIKLAMDAENCGGILVIKWIHPVIYNPDTQEEDWEAGWEILKSVF